MYNKELIEKIYKEESKKFESVSDVLLHNFPDDKNAIKTAEQIVDILVSLKLDIDSLCVGFIFPFVKNHDKAQKIFGDEDINFLLGQVIKCEEFSKKYEDADGLKNMLVAIAKDIRAIVIKVAQMLVFARDNVKNVTDSSVKERFNAIDDIFVPIAARLGLSEIKSELQDLLFEFREPEKFQQLNDEIKKETSANSALVEEMVSKIKDLVKGSGIYCKCYGRIKHISSIYNKLSTKSYTLKNIFDISAVRILVDRVSECYQVLGLVHANFTPVDGRFKDYIANPKPNGYKSLHTSICYKGEFFEVQIRTNEMHEFAEYGIAAHFLYKEHKSSLNDLDQRLLWIRKMLENKDNVSSEDILMELKTDVYLGEIFVQTPKGKIIKLVENSTPIDFAYAIHSDIGNKCTGAKVNGSMVSLTSSLSNGDVIEILTSQNSKGPSKDWLNYVKMQSTKDKINTFFKKQMREENIVLGKTMIEQCAKANDENLKTLWREEWIDKILKKSSFISVDELYASVGYGTITAEKVISRLISLRDAESKKNKTFLDEIAKPKQDYQEKSNIIGVQGSLTKFCKCCNPLPGDEIIGYVSRGRGIIIHKKNCENISKLQSSRFINVDWNTQKKDFTFTTTIELVTKNTQTIYNEISTVFSGFGVKVTALNTNQNKNGELILKIGVLVRDVSHLSQLKNKLQSLKDVYEVK